MGVYGEVVALDRRTRDGGRQVSIQSAQENRFKVCLGTTQKLRPV